MIKALAVLRKKWNGQAVRAFARFEEVNAPRYLTNISEPVLIAILIENFSSESSEDRRLCAELLGRFADRVASKHAKGGDIILAGPAMPKPSTKWTEEERKNYWESVRRGKK